MPTLFQSFRICQLIHAIQQLSSFLGKLDSILPELLMLFEFLTLDSALGVILEVYLKGSKYVCSISSSSSTRYISFSDATLDLLFITALKKLEAHKYSGVL